MDQERNPLEGLSDDQVVLAYIERRNWLQAEAKKFAEYTEPYSTDMERLAAEMLRRLLERGARNTSTEHGTAFIQPYAEIKCIDKTAMLQFAMDNFDTYGKDLLTANVSRDTVELYITKTKSDEHPEGVVPPGISVKRGQKVIFRKG